MVVEGVSVVVEGVSVVVVGGRVAVHSLPERQYRRFLGQSEHEGPSMYSFALSLPLKCKVIKIKSHKHDKVRGTED